MTNTKRQKKICEAIALHQMALNNFDDVEYLQFCFTRQSELISFFMGEVERLENSLENFKHLKLVSKGGKKK